jgi:hypothetical protein
VTRAEARKRVRRGAGLLDEKVGKGWPRRVSLRRLDMAQPCRCILGQLFHDEDAPIESFSHGIEELQTWGSAVEAPGVAHGFDVPAGSGGPGYEQLFNAWRDEIRKRRA